jgi:hypothetical protein
MPTLAMPESVIVETIVTTEMTVVYSPNWTRPWWRVTAATEATERSTMPP